MEQIARIAVSEVRTLLSTHRPLTDVPFRILNTYQNRHASSQTKTRNTFNHCSVLALELRYPSSVCYTKRLQLCLFDSAFHAFCLTPTPPTPPIRCRHHHYHSCAHKGYVDPILQGASAETGDAGFPGHQGAQGSPGPDGALGVPGQAGTDGQDGIPGQTGEKGYSGPKGDTGAPGADGADGITGARGPKGTSSGNNGDAGATGDKGSVGPDGE